MDMSDCSVSLTAGLEESWLNAGGSLTSLGECRSNADGSFWFDDASGSEAV